MDEERSPHDGTQPEPLGPFTPDDQTPAGDTPEAHDEIVPQDLPPDYEGRGAAREEAEDSDDGTITGNVE